MTEAIHARPMERWRAFWQTRHGPYVVALLLQLALAPWFIHDWDGFVFLRTVEDFLTGVTPYQTAERAPDHIFVSVEWPSTNSWYAYPPGALLLMTPGILAAKLLGVTDPYVLRAALKLPLILGNLLLAYVVGRTVANLGGDAGARRKAELLILLNPLLIFVAALWGMFDAWMMALLLLSGLFLHERRPVLAGLAFAGATLIKVFPLFVAPIFLAYALARFPRRVDAAKFVGVCAAAFALVCLPFLLSSPAGFWQQVVGMHLARPIQGFALVGLPYLPRFMGVHFGLDLWPLPPDWVGPALGTMLLVPGLLLCWTLATRPNMDLRRLLWISLATFLVVLLTGKVVNEQYFLMPITLLAVLACAPGGTRLLRGSLAAWTWGGFVASLVIGFHLFTFMPKDVSLFLFGYTPEETIFGLGVAAEAWFGLPARRFFVLSDVVACVALIPAFLLSAWILAAPLREGVGRLRAETKGPLPRRVAALAAVLLLLAGPVAVGTAAVRVADEQVPPPLPPVGAGLVGITYYVWWNNPSHDPAIADANWERLATHPASGYYTSTGHRMERDVEAFREMGVDFVLVSHHGYEHARYETLARIAHHHGLRFAPLVEPSVLLGEPAALAVAPDGAGYPALRPTDHVAARYADLARVALSTRSDEAHLREEGNRVVFLNDVALVGPSWDAESKASLARAVLARHGGSFDALAAAWGEPVATLDDLVARHPANRTAFDEDDGVPAADWRAALDALRADAVERVRGVASDLHLVVALPPPGRDAPWTALADATFSPGIHHAAAQGDREAFPDAWLDQQDDAAWATLHHAVDERPHRGPDGYALPAGSLGALWDRAEARHATRLLLASWNHHHDGTAFEPTREHGDAPMREAQARIAAFRTRVA